MAGPHYIAERKRRKRLTRKILWRGVNDTGIPNP
jgi:hypothetical protein